MEISFLRLLRCPFCGGKLNVTETTQTVGELQYGVMTCYCGRYPVVAGIPVLKKDALVDDVLALIEGGRHQEALLSLVSPSSPALAPAWMKSLPPSISIRWLKHLAHRRALRGWRKQAAGLLRKRDGQATACDLFAFYFRNKNVYDYFALRFGQPRHLVALSLASIIHKPKKPILDVACGCGHITRALKRRAKDQLVIGLDEFFFGLYVAKRRIAPEAEYVCCAADSSLPFPDGAFSTVFCSDAFHYFLNKATNIRELKRLTRDNDLIILTWIHNALFRRPYDGFPLPPEGYQALVAEMPHCLMADRDILNRYLQKQGPALARSADLLELAHEPLLSVVASHRHDVFHDHGFFQEWPHAEGCLGLSPLYVEDKTNGRRNLHLRRVLPSAFYEEDHAESKQYLPEELDVGPEVLADLAQGKRTSAIERLIEQCVVLDMPERYH